VQLNVSFPSPDLRKQIASLPVDINGRDIVADVNPLPGTVLDLAEVLARVNARREENAIKIIYRNGLLVQ
jgi:hypothetical protein